MNQTIRTAIGGSIGIIAVGLFVAFAFSIVMTGSDRRNPQEMAIFVGAMGIISIAVLICIFLTWQWALH